jgi:hypothetical protein
MRRRGGGKGLWSRDGYLLKAFRFPQTIHYQIVTKHRREIESLRTWPLVDAGCRNYCPRHYNDLYE